MNKIIEQNNEYRIIETNGLMQREDAHCDCCRFAKKVGDDEYNCYEGGALHMGKKDNTKPAKMCCMSWCNKFQWME